MQNTRPKQVQGHFDHAQNILHLWFPQPVVLRDADTVTAFFDEVLKDWIAPTPDRFYLLVNYQNLHIAAQVAEAYSAGISRFQNRLHGTYRYGLPGDFTGVAVSLGNIKLQAPANLFDSESDARAAIDRAKKSRQNT